MNQCKKYFFKCEIQAKYDRRKVTALLFVTDCQPATNPRHFWSISGNLPVSWRYDLLDFEEHNAKTHVK